MKKLQKRNLVTLAVLAFVCMAMYLNWRYTDDAAQAGKVLGEATLVSGGADAQENAAELPDTGAPDYFAAARLSRQQARDNATAFLQDAQALQEADGEQRGAAAQSLQVMAEYTMAESQIENLVTAKGYVDCVAFMGEDSISVVVSNGEAGITSTDVAKITDIVMTQTDYGAGHIKILEADRQG